MKGRLLKHTVYFLIIFYSVGIAGFIIPQSREFFSKLTPFALVLSILLLVYFHRPKFLNLKLLLLFTGIYVVSFLVEMAGVKTGIIFGNYKYGGGLGLKIMETPLMIGVNWIMLVYCTKVISDIVPVKKNFRPVFASVLMVIYDVILEQMAPLLDMWSWKNDVVPFQNYFAWFILSLLFHVALFKVNIRFTNKLAFPVFIIQALFFVILLIYNSIIK